ncbi:MAG: hypothetical protein PGN29_19170 [Gordonia paraffinivorans]
MERSGYGRVRRRLLVASVAAVAAIPLIVACGSADDGPRAAASSFLATVASRHLDDAAGRTDSPDTARTDLAAAWSGLQAQGLRTEVGRSRVDADTATVDVTWSWALPRQQTWSYGARLDMARSDSGWRVRWTSTDLHPDLGATQRMSLQSIAAPVGSVNESDGSSVLVPRLGLPHRSERTAGRADGDGRGFRAAVGRRAATFRPHPRPAGDRRGVDGDVGRLRGGDAAPRPVRPGERPVGGDPGCRCLRPGGSGAH